MSIVRFATLCDRCGSRSEEYTAWAICRECSDDVCPNCSTNPGTRGVTLGGGGFAEMDAEIDVADCLQCVQETT